jgi:signal transduction histidine kinase
VTGIWKHGPTLLLLAVLVTVVVYVGVIVRNDYETRESEVGFELRAGLERFVDVTRRLMHGYEAVARTLAETDCVRNRGSQPCDDLFARVLSANPEAVNFAAVDRDGRFFASGLPIPSQANVSALPFFTELAAGRRDLYVMDPHEGPVSGEPVTGIVVPLHDDQGRFDGLIGASMRFSELETAWRHVRAPDEHIGLMVFDRNLTPIFASDKAAPFVAAVPERDALAATLANGQGLMRLPGGTWRYAAETVPDYGWAVMAIHPAEFGWGEYLSESMLRRLLPPMLVLGALALALSWRDWRNVSRLERKVARRTAELARTVDELETFAWVASHDLREPMRAVSTYVTLLERRYSGLLDDEGRSYVNYARTGAQRLNRLVLDLLDYVRAGKEPGVPVLLHSGAVAADAVAGLRPLVEASAATITIAPDMPDLLMVEAELHRLFQHLIDNAVRHRHPERPPRVMVSAAREGGHWVFRVTDNGIGIEPQYFGKVFVIFQRLDPAGHADRTGVGLAICRKIVDAQGGHIWIESAPGDGSTFLFTLPGAERRQA